jgi:replicative DNA helicase
MEAPVRGSGMRLRLVVIDYLQLLQPDTREKDLYTRITEVSKGVKAVAKANDVADHRAGPAQPRRRAARR